MAMTQFEPLWRFVLDHPYWLDAGDSPWLESGVPEGLPEWYAIGAGSAEIREGDGCDRPGCPF